MCVMFRKADMLNAHAHSNRTPSIQDISYRDPIVVMSASKEHNLAPGGSRARDNGGDSTESDHARCTVRNVLRLFALTRKWSVEG